MKTAAQREQNFRDDLKALPGAGCFAGAGFQHVEVVKR